MKGLPESIDRLIAVEFRGDGVLDGVIEPLYRAARTQHNSPLAWDAAVRLREAAKSGKTIYIATGHMHPVAMPVGETDGPPGAAALARALVLSTMVPIVMLCESSVRNTLVRTCEAAGLNVRADDSGLPMPRCVAVQEVPIDPDEATVLGQAVARKAAAIVSIEKIGRALDGGYYTAMLNDVRADLAKVDILVDAVRRAGGLTIGIGDLGNEIGMGLIAETVAAHVQGGAKIACVVPTDVLVVAGCSNWGAYGITAALAGLERDLSLVHTAEIERQMILECCRAGGVDGFSTGPTLEVDGARWQTHAAFVQLLRDVVEISISTRKPERYRAEAE